MCYSESVSCTARCACSWGSANAPPLPSKPWGILCAHLGSPSTRRPLPTPNFQHTVCVASFVALNWEHVNGSLTLFRGESKHKDHLSFPPTSSGEHNLAVTRVIRTPGPLCLSGWAFTGVSARAKPAETCGCDDKHLPRAPTKASPLLCLSFTAYTPFCICPQTPTEHLERQICPQLPSGQERLWQNCFQPLSETLPCTFRAMLQVPSSVHRSQ